MTKIIWTSFCPVTWPKLNVHSTVNFWGGGEFHSWLYLKRASTCRPFQTLLEPYLLCVFVQIQAFAGRISSGENYRNMVNHRLKLLNWLDPMQTSTVNGDSSFHKADLFARPTMNALRAGWAGQGGVRIVNCFNRNQTGFPQLTYSMLGMFISSFLLFIPKWTLSKS